MPQKYVSEFNTKEGPVRVGYYPANADGLEVSIRQGDDVIKLSESELEYLMATLQAIKNVAPAMKFNEPSELQGSPLPPLGELDLKGTEGLDSFGLGTFGL